MTPLSVFLLFVSTILVKCDNNLNCQDLTARNTYEFEKGAEFAVLKVILSGEVSSYDVTGPKPTFNCNQFFIPIERDSSSNLCRALRCDNVTIVAVVIPKFDFIHAGIWTFKSGFFNSESQYNHIKAYGTVYDERLHNKTIEVRNEEYIVMILKEIDSENSNCTLINEGTNERYNLSDVAFRFPENKANFLRVNPCGIRLLVENGTRGNWSLVKESGWNSHKAHFEVRINSSIIRGRISPTVKYLVEQMKNEYWFEGFEGIFPVSRDLFSKEFFELENPNKEIIRLSEMSQENINVGRASIEDNGIWKIRFVDAGNLGILTEKDFSVRVQAFPCIDHNAYFHHGDRRYYSTMKISLTNLRDLPRTCTLKYGNESLPDCKIEKDESRKEYTIRIAEGIIAENDIPKVWELSMDHVIFKLNVLLNHTKLWIWHSRQMQKYVNRGKTLKIRCLTDTNIITSLKKCSLMSPQGMMYIRGDSSSMIDLGYYKNRAWGCMVTIENVNEEHNGTWTCKMDYFGGPELQSSVSVQVTESDLIPGVEQTNNMNRSVYLHCQLSPAKRFRKIVLCEWFHGNDSIKEDSKNYTVSKNDKKCSLEVKNPNENDIGKWKCYVRLDLGGNRNTTVEFQRIFMKEKELNGKFGIGKIRFAITNRIIAIHLPFYYIYVLLMSTIGVIWAYIFCRNHKQNHYRKIPIDNL